MLLNRIKWDDISAVWTSLDAVFAAIREDGKEMKTQAWFNYVCQWTPVTSVRCLMTALKSCRTFCCLQVTTRIFTILAIHDHLPAAAYQLGMVFLCIIYHWSATLGIFIYLLTKAVSISEVRFFFNIFMEDYYLYTYPKMDMFIFTTDLLWWLVISLSTAFKVIYFAHSVENKIWVNHHLIAA